ncbi:hypothetical protein CXG81DRAFT_25846 [Caulochytrium protostelioides]|uniref:Calcium uniporter protein, mitochondrial n=1 Tax=Caulochytrium protostelioides TaxID=1555241 RepID=A0A4P9X901_9FUNG|nr:hypothetical protein CXG81DRAFT_25846 [Caulochytrium protostelioides]|eukprot:RKP01461.1 hypothetical protein CXG81DRAFT_25846 [Caulochytrium protostelioides]
MILCAGPATRRRLGRSVAALPGFPRLRTPTPTPTPSLPHARDASTARLPWPRGRVPGDARWAAAAAASPLARVRHASQGAATPLESAPRLSLAPHAADPRHVQLLLHVPRHLPPSRAAPVVYRRVCPPHLRWADLSRDVAATVPGIRVRLGAVGVDAGVDAGTGAGADADAAQRAQATTLAEVVATRQPIVLEPSPRAVARGDGFDPVAVHVAVDAIAMQARVVAHKYEQLAQRFAAIDQIDGVLDAKAARNVRRLAKLLLTWVALQLAAVIFLTLELGWDLMEPVSYLIIVGQAILTSACYLLLRREPSYENLGSWLHQLMRRRQNHKHGFTPDPQLRHRVHVWSHAQTTWQALAPPLRSASR